MKVNIFATCLGDLVKANVVKDTVLLLEKLGCEILFQEKQGCCGQPALNSGYVKDSKPAMKSLIEALDVNDYPIVSPAGSCAYAIKGYPTFLADEPEWAERAKRVSDRLIDITCFIVNTLGIKDVGASLPGKAVYHPSCALSRKLGVVTEPLELLKHVKGLELLPFANSATCCGFGGTFSVKMSEISGAMVTEKVKHIKEVNPDYVIGADTSCLINIEGRIRRENLPIKVLHISQVLMSK